LAYRIIYSPDAEDPLRALTARHQGIVLDTVDKQLTRQPVVETKNRKPMRPNPLAASMAIENADWETISLSNNPKFLEILERSRKRPREEGGISSDEMRRRSGLTK
jgi:hypothetical protein